MCIRDRAYPDADAQDLGYWSPPFCLDEKDKSNPVITYSIPLKDESGSPYGVLGVEISGLLLSLSLIHIQMCIRDSAMPEEGVKALVDFMKDFEAKNA